MLWLARETVDQTAVLTALTKGKKGDPMEDQRKFVRYETALDAMYTTDDDNNPRACRVMEISQEGVRLRMPEKIPFGKRIGVHIIMPEDHDVLETLITVKWSKEIYGESDSMFLTGGEIKIDDQGTWQKLLAYAGGLEGKS